jgi:hypothetical protein
MPRKDLSRPNYRNSGKDDTARSVITIFNVHMVSFLIRRYLSDGRPEPKFTLLHDKIALSLNGNEQFKWKKRDYFTFSKIFFRMQDEEDKNAGS